MKKYILSIRYPLQADNSPLRGEKSYMIGERDEENGHSHDMNSWEDEDKPCIWYEDEEFFEITWPFYLSRFKLKVSLVCF